MQNKFLDKKNIDQIQINLINSVNLIIWVNKTGTTIDKLN